jgi:hypothetical protein
MTRRTKSGSRAPRCAVVSAWCLLAAAFAVAPSLAEEKPLPDVKTVLKELRKTVHTDRALLSQYTYLEKNTEKRLDKKGHVTQTETKTIEMYPSIEEDLSYSRVVAKDGKPIDKAELAQKDDEQRKKVLEWSLKLEHESAADKEKRLAKVAEEYRKENAAIDEAFALYSVSVTGRETVDGHQAIVLAFQPKPDFKTTTDAGKILKKVRGRIWVDERAYEMIRIDAELTDTVSFGLGVLARLSPGAHATFQRRLVNNEIWLPAESRFTGNARIMLFKGLRLDATSEYSDYKKFSVDTSTSFSPARPTD